MADGRRLSLRSAPSRASRVARGRLAIESAGLAGEILDASFRSVFLSTETARILGLSAEDANRLAGKSLIVRSPREDEEIMRVTEESGAAWCEHNAPIMRRYLEPGDPDFAEVFGPDGAVRGAARTGREAAASLARHRRVSVRTCGSAGTMLGDQSQVQVRINDDAGRFIGVLYLYRATLPESLLHRLGRGDPRLFERMERVSEPAGAPRGILFADLEASGALSRRLSSRGYFDLIRDLTDLIDSSRDRP